METITYDKMDTQQYLQALNWRYATKTFDASKKLSKEQLNELMTATQLSASSFGLQAYKILVIEDKALREKLRAASWGQSQITDASQLFVFCVPSELTKNHVQQYMELIAKTRNLPVDALNNFADYINGFIANFSEEQKAVWMAKQTYIALGSLLSAAAVMQIDACPMEGFDASAYDEILDLKSKGLKSVVVAAAGFRSSEDKNATITKVRKPLNVLFETI